MAEAYYVPVSPHDAAGPVNLLAGAHVMATVPNFYRLETSTFDLAVYNELLQEPLANPNVRLQLPARPPGPRRRVRHGPPAGPRRGRLRRLTALRPAARPSQASALLGPFMSSIH